VEKSADEPPHALSCDGSTKPEQLQTSVATLTASAQHQALAVIIQNEQSNCRRKVSDASRLASSILCTTSEIVLRLSCAISLRADQKGSSKLTLVLCPAMTIERFTILANVIPRQHVIEQTSGLRQKFEAHSFCAALVNEVLATRCKPSIRHRSEQWLDQMRAPNC
jgi:hypothetical protein